MTCGDLRFAFTIDPFERRRLLEGLDDIALTLEHEAEITAFEAQPARVDAGPGARRGGLVKANIVVLPGDGVGPEVVNAALSVLATVCDAVDARGEHRRAPDRRARDRRVRHAAARRDPRGVQGRRRRPARCRRRPGVGPPARRAALRGRPARACAASSTSSPTSVRSRCIRISPTARRCAPRSSRGTDLVIVRELTGGAYFGQPRAGPAADPTRSPATASCTAQRRSSGSRGSRSSSRSRGAASSSRSTRPTC